MRHAALSQTGGESGITLIEVMVAVLVLSIGTVAAFRSFDAARQQIGDAPERLFAEQVALNRAVAFQVLGREAGFALPAEEQFAGRDWQVEVIETATLAGYSELRIRAIGQSGAGAVLATFLPPAEQEPGK